MLSALRLWLPATRSPQPTPRPSFRPRLETLDDRLTPALGFAPQQAVAAGTAPVGLSAADFNGDGRPDIAYVNNTGTTSFSVRLNNTSAGSSALVFDAPVTVNVAGGAVALATGDVNGDGRADIVVSNPTTNTVKVYRNTTALGATVPSFAAAVSFNTSANPGAVELADFNLDGRLDIAIVANTTNILFNTTPVGSAAVSFGAFQSLANDENRASLAVGDFNGDSRPDLVTSFRTNIQVYVNNTVPHIDNPAATASFQFQFVGSAATGAAVGVGDFNADGRLDIVATDGTNQARILRNTTAFGAATLTFAPQTAVPLGAGTNGEPMAGDFDGDGRTEFVAANFGNTVSVPINLTPANQAQPVFSAAPSYVVGNTPNAVTTADFNGDGRLDVVTANQVSNTLSFLVNSSTNVTVTGPSLIAQFGNTGVWRYNRVDNTWSQLTASNATLLATAPNGRAVASFGDNGVWYYNPTSGWAQINALPAVALAMDGLGNVYGSFAGFGTFRYGLASGWTTQISTVVADRLAVNDTGALAANLPGFGVYRYIQATGLRQLNANTASAVGIAGNGDVVASFTNFGVNIFRPTTGGQLLNGAAATTLAVAADGAVIAHFAGYGVAKYIAYAGGWQTIAPAATAQSVGADAVGGAYAAFDGFGVWEYSFAGGWRLRRANSANPLAVGG